jgi:hypothetical protein
VPGPSVSAAKTRSATKWALWYESRHACIYGKVPATVPLVGMPRAEFAASAQTGFFVALWGALLGYGARRQAAACALQGSNRRAVLAAAPFLLCAPGAASASYAMQQAHEQAHTWTATDKARERAAYESIEADIDKKRRFRPEVGELGYVDGSYTKKSAAKAYEAQYVSDEKLAPKKEAASQAFRVALDDFQVGS